MPHSHASLLAHVVFSTKERRPLLSGELRPRLFPYMQQTARQYGGEIHIVDGATDHVHLLISLPTNRSLAEILRVVKCNSSRWVSLEFPDRRDFGWQSGYAAFSVSHSKRHAVYQYIAGQQEHDRIHSFQDEFIALLKKHQIEYDERYVWT